MAISVLGGISTLKDLVGMLKNVKQAAALNSDKNNWGDIADNFLNIRADSVSNRAQENIFQFPILISTALTSQTANIILKSFERKYANEMKIVLANYDVIDIDSTTGGSGNLSTVAGKRNFLLNFHQNNPVIESASSYTDTHSYNVLREAIHMQSIQNLQYYDECYNTTNLNNISLGITSESINYKKDDLIEIPRQKRFKLSEMRSVDNGNNNNNPNPDSVIPDNSVSVSNVGISDSDIKKNNELEPTILNVDVQYKTQSQLKTEKLLLGIKCILHGIPSDEMVYYIPDAIVGSNRLFNLVRWTTGEIKFWKDVVLDYDRIKFNATSKKASVKWWKFLRDRSNIRRMQAAMGTNQNSKFLVPNTSLVISYNEYEIIKQKNGVDFINKDKDYAVKLMDKLFLLNFSIIDEVSEVVYIFNDKTKVWETYSFEALRKENKASNSDIKALVSLLK